MSFSFSARAASKAALLAAIACEMGRVVEAQPAHAADVAAVNATAEAYVNLLPDTDAQDYSASLHGYIGWVGDVKDPQFVGASVGVSVRLVNKE